jgi:hypothetical protein
MHVVSNRVPVASEVLGDVEFLILAAGFVLEVGTFGPGRSEDPVSLTRMELESVDTTSIIHSSVSGTTVFSDPVDTFIAEEEEHGGIDRAYSEAYDRADLGFRGIRWRLLCLRRWGALVCRVFGDAR